MKNFVAIGREKPAREMQCSMNNYMQSNAFETHFEITANIPSPLPLRKKGHRKNKSKLRQRIIKPLQPLGVTDSSSVVRQQQKILNLFLNLKINNNCNVVDNDNPTSDREKISHNLHRATYVVEMDYSDA